MESAAIPWWRVETREFEAWYTVYQVPCMVYHIVAMENIAISNEHDPHVVECGPACGHRG